MTTPIVALFTQHSLLQQQLASLLRRSGLRVRLAPRVGKGGLEGQEPGAVLLHPIQSREALLADLQRLRHAWPGAPVLTLVESSRLGSTALDAGAFDELRIPVDAERLRQTIGRALAAPWPGLEPGAGAAALAGLSLEHAARLGIRLRDLEDRYIDEVLALTGGNKVQAARILGIDRKTLYRRAERRLRSDSPVAAVAFGG